MFDEKRRIAALLIKHSGFYFICKSLIVFAICKGFAILDGLLMAIVPPMREPFRCFYPC